MIKFCTFYLILNKLKAIHKSSKTYRIYFNNILEEEEKYSIYIQKGDLVMPWKDFNKNMAVSIEYDLKW